MIKEPMVMEIAKNTYAINEFGLSACYFLVGEERVHIPQELRIRSRGTERHSASN